VKRDRLRELLRDAPVPEEREAEERGLRIISAAFRERTPTPRSQPRARLALALAAALALPALVLSPAGGSVRDWIGDVFEPGVEDAEPVLTRLPGGGRLLVDSAQGPWLVHPDGSRRLLGDYEEAGWSPRGLYVVAVKDRTLVALEPDGDPRWSLSRPQPIADPRWSSFPGYRIAYRAGDSLRVVAGDGTDDALLARGVKPIPPSWRPGPAHVLAYVDGGGALRIVNTDTGTPLASLGPLAGVSTLSWAPDGTALLQVATSEVRLTELRSQKIGAKLAVAATHTVPLPPGATVRAVAFSPDGEELALLLSVRAPVDPPFRSEKARELTGLGQASQVLLADRRGNSARRLMSAPGRLDHLAWSPDGRRLLITWRDADQWLFIPAAGRGRTTAVDRISRQFSPGAERPSFPAVDVSGWCCPR
jgi:hypothetical protein